MKITRREFLKAGSAGAAVSNPGAEPNQQGKCHLATGPASARSAIKIVIYRTRRFEGKRLTKCITDAASISLSNYRWPESKLEWTASMPNRRRPVCSVKPTRGTRF